MIPSPDNLATQFENLFQNGAPKVFVVDHNGIIRPSFHSGARTSLLVDNDEQVRARRKRGRQYVWMRLK